MSILKSLLVAAILLGCGLGLTHATDKAPQPVNANGADVSNICGVWRGQMEGLPAVTLVVTDEGGSLTGAVVFYFHERKTANDPWTSAPGLPEPMFRIQFDGRTLTFQISHRRAHPPRTLSDPPVILTLRLTGPNRAEFVNQSERSPILVMVWSDS
ncbi:MAG: hypothetical protein ABSF23_01490 [Terracidiphilus sp.]|jgi:hypothetical protein